MTDEGVHVSGGHPAPNEADDDVRYLLGILDRIEPKKPWIVSRWCCQKVDEDGRPDDAGGYHHPTCRLLTLRSRIDGSGER